MTDTINTTIDSAGRLVLPKAIRERAGLRPGMPLTIRFFEGHIEIEPAPKAVRLVKKGAVLVAVPEDETALLSEHTVAETRHQLTERDTAD